MSDRIVDIVGENVDCVVRGGEITDQSLVARHVGDLQLGMYAAPGYLQHFGTPEHPANCKRGGTRLWGFYGFARAKPCLTRCSGARSAWRPRATRN